MNRVASAAILAEQIVPLETLAPLKNWTINESEYPRLDVTFGAEGRTPFRVQMAFDDWDTSPPSIRFAKGDGSLLSVLPSGPTGIFHQGPHARTGRPFLCMAGSLEYHTHESHIGDVWDNYKGKSGWDALGILNRIWNGWLKSTS